MDSLTSKIQTASSFEELDQILSSHQNLSEEHQEILFQRMCWLATGGSPVTLSGAQPNGDGKFILKVKNIAHLLPQRKLGTTPSFIERVE